jgi:hypothetical protein
VILVGTTLVLAGASAAAGTLLVFRGSVIPAPAARDVPPEQTPVAGTSHVEPISVADPAGGPHWTLRVARSRTGLLCSTVGQLEAGRFGLVGLDGRFRLLAPRIVDACSARRSDGASLIGARVFDARRAQDLRTVVNGIAGRSLRTVTIESGGRSLPVARAPGGVFLAVLAGYPEDLGLRVMLTFADGHRVSYPFGRSSFIVPDPSGGHAWKAQAFAFGSPPGKPPDPRTCVSFQPARIVRNPPISPAACGNIGIRARRGYFFAVRHIVPGTGGIPFSLHGQGHWGNTPARTAVWGAAGDDVRRIQVLGPGGLDTLATIAPSRAFLAVLPGTVDPASLSIRVTFTDGQVEVRRGSTHLVSPDPRYHR